MVHLAWIFLMQLATLGCILLLLQNQIKMKKQIEEITREVEKYITYITEDIVEETKEVKHKNEAEHNELIQAVLGEYFP